ncbi:matrixin family metalloprotease [Streptomyces sp. NPDC048179]|uniref:matrixin family metalloprotease n=1 Tax=Streptomyces sp. NPDC048179 TaxID=3365506 RepID=UPI00371B6FC5
MSWRNPGLVGRTITALALLASLSAVGSSANVAVAGADVCEFGEGDLTISDLPAGSSVIKCDAVGRVVTYDDTGLTVPEPGTAVSIDALATDGGTHGFTMEVASDGKVSYDLTQGSDSTDADASDAAAEGAEVADTDALGSTGACSDGAYATADRKEYGTYNWYIGDDGMPGGLSRTDAKWVFYDAIDNITDSYNNCGYSDTVGARANFLSETSYEADINDKSQCTSWDGLSTWDAGDLKGDHVAVTCSRTWPMPGVKNDLREADVRFNTHDHDFTNKPTSSCTNRYDIRAVGTHEAGHVFGLGHVGSGHENLTMFTNSFLCNTKARTLGKGDVLGLRSIY